MVGSEREIMAVRSGIKVVLQNVYCLAVLKILLTNFKIYKDSNLKGEEGCIHKDNIPELKRVTFFFYPAHILCLMLCAEMFGIGKPNTRAWENNMS